MTSRPADDELPPELLAGYADGELSARARTRVEAWLAEHPEAREGLEIQEAFGPANAEFWRAVRPPAPTKVQWERVRQRIADPIPEPVGRPWMRRAGVVALLATAAMLLILVTRPDPPTGPNAFGLPVSAASEDEDDEPILLARADEMHILSLPEALAGLLVVGEHPLRDAEVLLARADEVEILGLGSDPEGLFPDNPATAEPPMIWAPPGPKEP